MAQQLILPLNKCKLTASWKTDSYKTKYGFAHYGVDMVSSAGSVSVNASGTGEVVAVGTDSVVGNVLCVLYPQSQNRVTGKTQDVIHRYYHLSKINVKKGDKLTTGTLLGTYGNTGSLTMPIHLHIEADTDTANPLFSPTVKSSSLLKGTANGANDKTMTSPLEWFYLKTTAPESQTYTTAADAYIRAEDKTIPAATEPAQISAEIARLREEIAAQKEDIIALNGQISALESRIAKVKAAIT